MADTIGLSDVSSKDTGKGKKLKTGNLKRSYNMPSPEKCKKSYKDLGYKSVQDCIDYKNTKKSSKSKSKKAGY
jgi:hypothetical protein